MSAIDNLGITPIASSQAQKEITANEAFERLAGAVAEKLVVAMADADVTLTSAQGLANASFECTGALTAGRNLIVPTASHKLYDVANKTTGGYAVTVRTTSGSGVAIAAGDEQVVRCDGADVVAVAAPKSIAALVGPQPYDIAGFYPGVPGSSALLLRFVAPRALTLPQSLTGSQASAGAAATAQTDIGIEVNDISKGTVRFAAAATTATFIFSTEVALAAGDVLTLIAPASADATLANIAITLAGTR
jgi:hypothetical protein